MLAENVSLDDFILLKADLTVKETKKILQTATAAFVIVERSEGPESEYFLYEKAEVLYRIDSLKGDVALAIALDLREYVSTETIPLSEPLDNLFHDEKYIVVNNNIPVGYLWPKSAMEEAVAPETSIPDDLIDDSLDLDDIDFIAPPSGNTPDKSDKGAQAVDDQEPGSDSSSFEAYPSISDPGKVEAGEKFKVYVGFSKELDETLLDVQKVKVAKPKENAFIQVSLMAMGASVADNKMKPLFLNVDSNAAFECTVDQGATEINLIATYFYEFQPVGMARRNIKVGEATAPGEQVSDKEEQGCSLDIEGVMSKKGKVDLTVTIKKDPAANQLQWKITAPDPEIDAFEKVAYEDARSFAKELGKELKTEDYKSLLAQNALQTLGQNIADLIPAEFFDAYKKVSEKINRSPRILIWTDEPYIPWELAYSNKLSLDKDAENFLGTQAVVGRWWLHQRVVSPPPTDIEVGRITAIAADYPFGSRVTPLEEAIKEKEYLKNSFAAEIVEAKKQPILEMTSSSPAVKGHIVHMALHGFSDPTHNEQKIIVEDGDLSPNAMIGVYNCGDVPPISFMFLNACQVGTAGATLGQASGFPGILLKKGMLGFVAPLWEVHDTHARVFAEKFYEEALTNNRPVAEVLLELRKNYNYEESLTPLAYLFYGNPGLTLEYEGAV